MICQFCGYEFDDKCGKYGCPNCNGEGLSDAKQPYSQTEADKRYRAKQLERGIVRKTVRVPAHRWAELQQIAAKMRDESPC